MKRFSDFALLGEAGTTCKSKIRINWIDFTELFLIGTMRHLVLGRYKCAVTNLFSSMDFDSRPNKSQNIFQRTVIW
jgi:hypothetical protein